jgi:hypothetical protein
VNWRHRSTSGRGDLPASTFDGSDETPSPYSDPDRNWVDQFVIISGSLLVPSRPSNRLYQRRLGLIAGLLFLADGVLAYVFGAQWLALGLILVGVAVNVVVRFRQIPLLAIWVVMGVVSVFVIPLGLDAGHSSASQPSSCQWLSTSEVRTVLGSVAKASEAPNSTHCSWSSSRAPSATTQLVNLLITYPTVVPVPNAWDKEVTTVGLRAWTSSTCDLSTCTESLFVVLSRGFLDISVSSHGIDPPAWQQHRTEQEARDLVKLGSLVAARASPPD